MIYGYARVSTKGQAKDGNSLEAQERILREHGAEVIYKDSFTGTKKHRPELDKLLSVIKEGDTLVVVKLDRIARSTIQGCELMNELFAKGVAVNVLNMGMMDNSTTGKLIRSKISSMLPKDKVFHLYTPQIPGKERRKNAPSKAGFLGVEDIDDDTLRQLFLPFAADASPREIGGITKTDLFTLGLTGSANSSEARDKLAITLGLPSGMTPNALLSAVNILFGREEFLQRAGEILHIEENEEIH